MKTHSVQNVYVRTLDRKIKIKDVGSHVGCEHCSLPAVRNASGSSLCSQFYGCPAPMGYPEVVSSRDRAALRSAFLAQEPKQVINRDTNMQKLKKYVRRVRNDNPGELCDNCHIGWGCEIGTRLCRDASGYDDMLHRVELTKKGRRKYIPNK